MLYQLSYGALTLFFKYPLFTGSLKSQPINIPLCVAQVFSRPLEHTGQADRRCATFRWPPTCGSYKTRTEHWCETPAGVGGTAGHPRAEHKHVPNKWRKQAAGVGGTAGHPAPGQEPRTQNWGKRAAGVGGTCRQVLCVRERQEY